MIKMKRDNTSPECGGTGEDRAGYEEQEDGETEAQQRDGVQSHSGFNKEIIKNKISIFIN